MAKSELERTVQQSLIDRLIDTDPTARTDPPGGVTWAQSVRQLKIAVQRDLEWLLNTRRTIVTAPEEYEEVRRSLHEYGLPDISSLSRDSGKERLQLLRRIEETIALFEPRLSGVRVTLADEEQSRREVHFLIEGLLRLDPNPEPVVFDTVLEVSSGEYSVTGASAGAGGGHAGA